MEPIPNRPNERLDGRQSELLMNPRRHFPFVSLRLRVIKNQDLTPLDNRSQDGYIGDIDS